MGVEITEWQGCYPSRWHGVIVPAAFRHPAKFSRLLIERIYAHVLEECWLGAGDRVIDPFGGVALGAYPALRYGLDWTGCELEAAFVDLGRENLALWNELSAGAAGWGTAHLLQGDSRYLAGAVAGAAACISSPPYATGVVHDGNGIDPARLTGNRAGKHSQAFAQGYGATPGQLGGLPAGDFRAVISSPPFENSLSDGLTQSDRDKYEPFARAGVSVGGGYGATPGQLGGLPAGDFRAVISSPPFMQASGGTNCTAKAGPLSDAALLERHAAGNAAAGYGATRGQLGGLPAGDFEAAISSPPFENGLAVHDLAFYAKHCKQAGQSPNSPHALGISSYGTTPGQLRGGATFWTCAREIVEQVYQVLAPGGHAVWVVKGYVKNRQLVDFPDQWRQMCEAVGFETMHEHHAMLVRYENGRKIETKSFFRRLAEKNGAPEINWETVLCMVKPG